MAQAGAYEKPVFIIEGARLGFLFAVLLVTLGLQTAQPQFVNIDVVLPVYGLLFFVFCVHTAFLLRVDKFGRLDGFNAFVFALDTFFVTTLIYFTGINYSIFLFLYLVNIILCSLMYLRRGAFALALWTSFLFSFLLILGPTVKGQALVVALVVNNLAFFTVAYLAGYLSQQLNFVGEQLSETQKDVAALQDINKAIVENVATGIMTVSAQGVVLQCNPAGQSLLGRGDGSGRMLQEFFPPLAEKLSAGRFELNWRNERMEDLIFEISISPIYVVANEVAGHIVLFQDLTQLKRLEFAMRQSEKLAAVGQLAAGIAHEIRNPLASISGSIQLIEDGIEGEEKGRLMRIILREIDRLNNLISEFLDFVRPDKPPTERIDLKALVEEVVEMTKLNSTLRSDIVFNRDLVLAEVIGHKDKLKQALLNIAINACQAMEKTAKPELSVSLRLEDSSVVLRIRDNGCGMSEENKKRIFEPFHTTKPKGTGLGLAVTHKIFESHQARVFVDSKLGEGSEFIIHFPVQFPRVKTEEVATVITVAQSSLEQQDDSPEDSYQRKRGSG